MHNQVYTIAKVCSEFGCTHAVICPGSRSAPLLFAFKQNTNITCIAVTDERSAGFIALGIAQQTKKPVVLICTSGTALLNFFPAVAEAKYQQIPLLVLSADRPPEMLNQQDGQMIMQKNVFGKHVNNSHELMCEDVDGFDVLLTQRIVQTALVESIQPGNIGPVHINVPLREPLYPQSINIEVPPLAVFENIANTTNSLSLKNLDQFSQAFKQAQKIVFLIGQVPPNQELNKLLHSFTQLQQVVVLADIVSNQQECSMAPNFDAIIQYADEDLLNELAPDMVISTGGPLVSKALKNWLKNCTPTWHFRISEEIKPINTYGNLTHHIRCSIQLLLSRFLELYSIQEAKASPYFLKWIDKSRQTQDLQKKFFESHIWSEPYVFNKLLNALPSDSILHIGNSGSIRFASWLGLGSFTGQVFGNRGTSGIEGSVSTAVGAAIANPLLPVYLICGDLSFFYDSNALWSNALPANLKIIVMNNGGGKIFEWIDGPSRFPEHLDFFTTPHQRSISSLSQHFGITCLTSDSIATFDSAINQLKQFHQTAVLELVFDTHINTDQIKKFKSIQLK